MMVRPPVNETMMMVFDFLCVHDVGSRVGKNSLAMPFDDGWDLLEALWVQPAYKNYSGNEVKRRVWSTTQELVSAYT